MHVINCGQASCEGMRRGSLASSTPWRQASGSCVAILRSYTILLTYLSPSARCGELWLVGDGTPCNTGMPCVVRIAQGQTNSSSMHQLAHYLQRLGMQYFPDLADAKYAEFWAHCRRHTAGEHVLGTHIDSRTPGQGQASVVREQHAYSVQHRLALMFLDVLS